jgi:hypothetical protein
MSEIEFDAKIKSVLVGVEERDLSLSEEQSRLFSEIAIHRY